jgi:hypothetical protein
MKETKNAYKILVRKPDGKNLFGRPRHRRVDNILIDFKNRVWRCGIDLSGSERGPVKSEYAGEP